MPSLNRSCDLMLETIWEDELEDVTFPSGSESTDDYEDDFMLCIRSSAHDGTSLDFSFTLPRTSHGESLLPLLPVVNS